MNPSVSPSLIRLTLFSVVLATQVSAQKAPAPPAHTRYQLVDLGTFGGPHSRIPFAQRDLNSAGAVVGISDTDIPDPFAPNCANPTCVVQQGFVWRDGVMTRLLGFFPNLESGPKRSMKPESSSGSLQLASLIPHPALQPSTPFFGIRTVFSISALLADLPATLLE